MQNIFPSGQHGTAQYCGFCGCEKKVFFNPLGAEIETQRSVEILKCDCEKKFQMLTEFLEANFEWLKFPSEIPKNIPDYGAGGVNVNERRHAQYEFVMRVKAKRDAMIEQRENLKWQMQETNKPGRT